RLTVMSTACAAMSASTASSAGRLPWMSDTTAIFMATPSALHAVRPLDLRDAQLEVLVPGAAAHRLRLAVLGVSAPAGDVLLAVEVRDRDAEAAFVACALDAEEARLRRGQLDHAVGRGAVALVARRALRAEDHRV